MLAPTSSGTTRYSIDEREDEEQDDAPGRLGQQRQPGPPQPPAAGDWPARTRPARPVPATGGSPAPRPGRPVAATAARSPPAARCATAARRQWRLVRHRLIAATGASSLDRMLDSYRFSRISPVPGSKPCRRRGQPRPCVNGGEHTEDSERRAALLPPRNLQRAASLPGRWCRIPADNGRDHALLPSRESELPVSRPQTEGARRRFSRRRRGWDHDHVDWRVIGC